MTGPSPEALARVQLEAARQEAREHQRRLMQGLGKPIISFENHGYRVVCVGKEVRWSKSWRTFPDFLFDFIKVKLTPGWGNAELAKPEAERHPLLKWYYKVCMLQQAQPKGQDGVYSAEMTGAVRAYLGLAYDLYLSAHNAELPELLLKRLRNPPTFEGAVYEARVIGSPARAGFHIELEDETDSDRSHCELTATHKATGRKFSVEAKAVTSMSSRSGSSAEPPRIRNQLYKALCKQTDHERVIFIELNRAGIGAAGEVPDWVQHIDAEIEQAEKDFTINGQPAPPAYVMVTNLGAVHALDSTIFTDVGLACGFKISNFAKRTSAQSILELVDAREKHLELHWLRKALHRQQTVPSTFDDRLPEEPRDNSLPRLLIGSTYLIPLADGREVPALLTGAVVLEPERRAYGTYRCADGTHVICTNPLSDAEMAAYTRSPQTFFGIIKDVSHEINEPMDAFDFFWGSHSETPKEKLIEFTSNWPDAAALRQLEQRRLAQVYCARFAENLWAAHVRDKNASEGQPNPPPP
jgi:hypothetical protein